MEQQRPMVLRLSEDDPVGVALVDLGPGAPIGVSGVVARTAVPRGHKVALRDLHEGETVTKSGLPIGCTFADISAGSHVHTHNLRFEATVAKPRTPLRNIGCLPRRVGAHFDGYVRADGRVGTRNMLLVMATVNCSATVVRQIAARFRAAFDLTAYPTIDGIVALTHQHGCSVRADGPGMELLRRTLAGYARHPNVAGVLVVGLGCEDNHVDDFLAASGLQRSDRLAVRVIQQQGGSAATVAAGMETLQAMLPRAAAARRSPVPASKLVVGLQCGGSDGFSALSANPALGIAADLLVAEGGTAVLSETPEIYGSESLLLDRTPDPAVAARLEDLLRWWRDQARLDGGTLDNNPSPGNKDGGITTILEKALGAVAKAGSSPVRDVRLYAEPIVTPGLVFMDSPGFDPVSVTGQVAAGANLICFTTGRGSCFGSSPAPSVKVATNTELFERMKDDMDINAGTIIDGTETHAQVGSRIFAAWLEIASGRKSASELLGYGEEEFAPWTPGLTY